ncbi:hypothetical protein KM043_012795 [Ampulex compressa]|nr:hypothetical protein KM043_012795 [Ampulex compressa]
MAVKVDQYAVNVWLVKQRANGASPTSTDVSTRCTVPTVSSDSARPWKLILSSLIDSISVKSLACPDVSSILHGDDLLSSRVQLLFFRDLERQAGDYSITLFPFARSEIVTPDTAIWKPGFSSEMSPLRKAPDFVVGERW